MTEQKKSKRFYFMDSMRSILMMLGVVLHSSNIFATTQFWLVYSEKTSIIADHISYLIHIFRMPTFFVISGFFCALTINRHPPKKFITIKIKRIIVPLITTAIILNSFQAIILTNTSFHNYQIKKYLLEGEWISHLWFLNNLIIYFSIATISTSLLKKPINIVQIYLTKFILRVPLVTIICVLPILSIIILGLNKIGFPLYYEFIGVFRTNIVLMYLPYFLFGTILATSNDLLHKFSLINPILASCIILVSLYIMSNFTFSNVLIDKIMHVYLEKLITWFAISLCFYIFYRFFNYPSKNWLFLSDASYTVYLFHHIFVIGIGISFVRLGIPPIFGLISLILITIIITLYIHKYIILRIKYARLLFNGK